MLIVTNGNGDTLWTKLYDILTSPPDQEYGYALSQTSDEGFILAGKVVHFDQRSDAFAIKTDSIGIVQWARTYSCFYNSYSEGAHSIMQTADGGYIFTGISDSTMTGYTDLWLVKLNASGITSWSKRFKVTGEPYSSGRSVLELASGEFVVCGSSGNNIIVLKTDVAGNIIWSKTYSSFNPVYVSRINEASNGDFVLSGWVYENNQEDALLLRMDNTGIVAWSRVIVFNSSSSLYDSDVHPNGNIVALGHGNIILTDSIGQIITSRRYDQNFSVSLTGIQYRSDESLIVVGKVASSLNYNSVYLLKTDSLGIVPCNQNTTFPANNSYSITTSIPTLIVIPGLFSSNSILLSVQRGCDIQDGCTLNQYDSNDYHLLELDVFPIPVTDRSICRIKHNFDGYPSFLWVVCNSLGMEVRVESISTSEFYFMKENLSSGMYFYSLLQNDRVLCHGKIIVR